MARLLELVNDYKMLINKRAFAVSIILVLFFIVPTFRVSAQGGNPQSMEFPKEENLEGAVVKVLEEKKVESGVGGAEQLYQKLELLVIKGSLKGRKIVVENGAMPMANVQKYRVGDRVIVSYTKDFKGGDSFNITDYVRRGSLLWLFAIFIILTVAVAKWRGVASLLGMGVSFFIIFKFILPKILGGADPIQTVLIGSLFIIPLTFYLSHGFNKKTTVAVVGTVIALVVTVILSAVFVRAARLTGFSSEEAGFLQIYKQGSVNIKGLLFAGIIIGVLGVLDDITISQSSVVLQLKDANPKLKFEELYRRAMAVGQDHISSMVNTLVLVYTGAALPLFLLFIDNPHPFSEIINYEVVASEIVRMLVGSIGLILAVPITTVIAAMSVLSVEKDKRFRYRSARVL